MPPRPSLGEADLERHLRRSRYGSFVLTDAIRPMLGSHVVPQEGYREQVYHDRPSRYRTNVLIAAVSSERLFDVFLDLLDAVGDDVGCGIMSSHDYKFFGEAEFFRESIELPVLKSALWDHEELLLNDGCTGVAVWNADAEIEVQLDEHKLLFIYAKNPTPFRRILADYRVLRVDGIQFVIDGEHVHISDESWLTKADEFVAQIGAEGFGADDDDSDCVWS